MSKLIVQMVINWATTLLRQRKYVASYHIPIHNQLIFYKLSKNIIHNITLVLMSYRTLKNWYFKMIMSMYKSVTYSMCGCNKYGGMKYCNHNDWCNVWTFYNKHQPLKGFVSLSHRLCVLFKWIPNHAFVFSWHEILKY